MEKDRLFFIDNLRILLICLVIMVHLSITYGGSGSWYYKEGRPDELSFALLTFHNAIVQAFSMGLFFMVAGYFTPASYDRKGPRQFMRDRLLRLGIPLLCYDFIINPLLAYLLIKAGVNKFDGSYRDGLIMYYSSFHIGTGPLWFVEALLIFAFVYVFWRLLKKLTAAPSHSNHKIPTNKSIALFSLALGLISFVVRIWLPVGWTYQPLNLQVPFFPQYICLFFVGIIAYRRNWLTGISGNQGKLWLSVAIVLIAVLPLLFVAGGGLDGDIRPFGGWTPLAMPCLQSLGAISCNGDDCLPGSSVPRKTQPARQISKSDVCQCLHRLYHSCSGHNSSYVIYKECHAVSALEVCSSFAYRSAALFCAW
jgi:fucose 4-O-acetylase-like acetyltransferase